MILFQSIFFFILTSFFHSPTVMEDGQKVEVFDIQRDKHVEIYCKNKSNSTQSVKITCRLEGMASTKGFPIIMTMKPNSKELVSILRPKKSSRRYSYKYQYEFVDNDVTAKHDDGHVYNLPFSKGKAYILGQGYNGHYSHHNSFSLDFNMDIGEAVHAMRGGKIIMVKENSNKGCPSSNCADYANRIQIEHSDKTVADYYHLAHKGSIVKVGQHVKTGQHIGYSGDTGWASGPHLHVKISEPSFDSHNPGLKTKFKTKNGAQYLQEKRQYSY